LTTLNFWQRWACNFRNVAPQKQNTICKTRAQHAKAIALLNYLKRITPQQLMLRRQITQNIFLAQLFEI
jgi:hypothetical protein